MPLVSVRAPSSKETTVHKAGQPDEKTNEGIDVVIVPAIGADPNVVYRRLQSPQSYFKQEFNVTLKDAVVLLFTYLDETQPGPDISSEIDRYAGVLLQDVATHRLNNGTKSLPIHFVGHSTGGLVIKKALLLAENSSRYSDISSSCRSIAFFGVPHQGSTVLSEAPFAQSVKRALGLVEHMSPTLRDSIQPDSKELRILATDFAFLARRMRSIWTFVENEDSTLKILASRYDAADSEVEVCLPIVDKRSAILQIGNETVIDLGTTHAGLLSASVVQGPTSMASYVKGLKSLLEGGLQKKDDINESIRTSFGVELHLFYNDSKTKDKPSIKLWSVYTELDKLIRIGPSKSFEARLFQTSLKPESPHLTIPNAITKLDFSRRPALEGRRASIQAVLDVDSTSNSYGGSSPFQGEAAPAITVTRTDTMPTTPSTETDRANDNSRVSPRDRLSVEPVVPPQFKSPGLNRPTEDTTKAQDLLRSRNSLTFQLPDPSQRRFRWVHVPCNNLTWIPEIMKCLMQENHDALEQLQQTLLREDNLYALQSVGRHGKPHSRQMKPSCKYWDHAEEGEDDPARTSARDCQLSIFLPYLHWDSFRSLKARNKLVDEIWSEDLEDSKKKSIRQGNSLEQKLIYQYLVDSANAPLHHRRTLDQYGYPDLRSTQARDEDQVLYKRSYRQEGPGDHWRQRVETKLWKGNQRHDFDVSTTLNLRAKGDEGGKVIMVDQLWCWVLDHNTVLTCFPPKEDEDERDKYSKPADLRNAIYNDVNGDPRFATQCYNVFDFAALVVKHATKVFIDDVADEDLQVFRIFEEYISVLIEQHTRSFKAFRDRYREKGAYAGLRNSNIASDAALSKIQEVDLRANEEDLTALLELRDIEDELNTVDKLFRDQLFVIQELEKQDFESKLTKSKGLSPIKSSIARIEGYRAQLSNMQTNCKSAQEAFMRLLDMKQKQANLAEAWAAREASVVASSQNRAVMVFTIFTIIFLPLGFFTSLFGMNTFDWSGNNTMPRLHVILLWTFPVSCVVTVIALLVAFNRYVRAKFITFFRLVRRPRQRRTNNEDLEQLIGLLKERDTAAGLRMANPAAVAMAGHGQIPISWNDSKPQKVD